MGKCRAQQMTDTTQRMNEDPNLTLPERHLLDSISRMPLIDSAELTGILGEAHATVHPRANRPAGRWHRRAREPRHRPPAVEPEGPPYGQRHQRGRGTAGLCAALGLRASLPRVQGVAGAAHIRRMDAVAAVYRLAASLSPGIDGLRSHVEFHRMGDFDATITLH